MVLILFLTINILLYKNDNEDLVAVGFKICFIDFYRKTFPLLPTRYMGLLVSGLLGRSSYLGDIH